MGTFTTSEDPDKMPHNEAFKETKSATMNIFRFFLFSF